MLQEIFYWIFNMSIIAALTGVLVLPVRRIRRLLKRLTVFLWIIPYVRMTLPIGLNSPYSLMTLLTRLTTKTVVVFQPTDGIAFSFANSIMTADSYFPITYKVSAVAKVFGVASVVWIIGASSILLTMIVTYVVTMAELKDSVLLRDNIYHSEKVTSPAVYGILKPKIILPLSYRDKNTEFVLLHERMHIRRLDNLWRLLALVVTAFHWFNPLCWIFLKCFLADVELSCDERVLAKSGADRAKEYAASLLESRQGTVVFASAFGGAKIRTRIENILSFRKLTRFSLAVFAVLIAAVCYVLLTNAG